MVHTSWQEETPEYLLFAGREETDSCSKHHHRGKETAGRCFLRGSERQGNSEPDQAPCLRLRPHHPGTSEIENYLLTVDLQIKPDDTHKARVTMLGLGMVAGVHCGSAFVLVSCLQSIRIWLALAVEKP